MRDQINKLTTEWCIKPLQGLLCLLRLCLLSHSSHEWYYSPRSVASPPGIVTDLWRHSLQSLCACFGWMYWLCRDKKNREANLENPVCAKLTLLIDLDGTRGSVVGWRTMLQAGRSQVRFPMRSLDFSIYLILPRNRDSVVGIATAYGLDDRGVGVRVTVGSRIFFSPRRPGRLWSPSSLLSNGYLRLITRE
jgi:hypothetical protein